MEFSRFSLVIVEILKMQKTQSTRKTRDVTNSNMFFFFLFWYAIGRTDRNCSRQNSSTTKSRRTAIEVNSSHDRRRGNGKRTCHSRLRRVDCVKTILRLLRVMRYFFIPRLSCVFFWLQKAKAQFNFLNKNSCRGIKTISVETIQQ